MSELFSYHPKGAETLEAFNGRLAQFCSEGAVVDVDISLGPGPIISLSMVEPDDIAVEVAMAVQPIIVLLETNVLPTLESYLADVYRRLEDAADKEGRSETFSIIRTRIHPMASDPNRGYAVILANIGAVTYEQPAEDTP